jgi:ligand-binding sensor domain-containing protein/two-component sensor histidine kinase
MILSFLLRILSKLENVFFGFIQLLLMRGFLFFLLLNCLLFPGLLYSQSYIFEHITTAEGLSSNKVNEIIQDREGFYWIATSDGLNRFDGSSFKIFRKETGNPSSLSHNFCKPLLEDIEGNIWVGTYNGVSIYDKKENKFRNIILQQDESYPKALNSVFAMVSDDEGNVWISCYGLWKFNMKTRQLLRFKHDEKDPATVSDDSPTSDIFYDRIKKGIWVLTGGGLNFMDISIDKFYHHDHNPEHWKIFDIPIANITMDRHNRLWFMDVAGNVNYFDVEKNEIFTTRLVNKESSNFFTTDDHDRVWMSHWSGRSFIYDNVTKQTDSSFFKKHHSRSALSESFNFLFIDRDKNYWISSINGISIFRPHRQFYKLYELPISSKEIQLKSIKALMPAGREMLWVGTVQGLYQFNLKTQDYKKINLPLADEYITTIYKQNDSVLWLGNKFSVHKFNTMTNKIIRSFSLQGSVDRIVQDTNNDLWIATWSDGLYKTTTEGKTLNYFTHQDSVPGSLPYNGIICMRFINKEIWLGLNRGYGFTRYDPAKNNFIKYQPGIENFSAKQTESVNVITANDENSFWLGTHGGGIYFWDKVSNRYRHFTQGEGLNSNFINSIYKDNFGQVWVSTSNGLNFFDSVGQKFLPVNIDLVFPTDDFMQNCVGRNDGRLFFFCMNKIVEIDPAQYESKRPVFPIVISNFKIFDKEKSLVAADSVIRLSYKQNFFSFEFSALRTNPQDPVQYAYKLEGFDKEWNYSGNRNFASYTNVPAGNYIFKVRSTNEHGEWSEERHPLVIIISPPFWKTWWFVGLTTATILVILYFLYRFRIDQLRKMFQLRTKISQDLHDEVAATLSGIRLYSELAKQQLEKMDLSKVNQSLDVISVNAAEMKQDMSDIIWAIKPGNDSLGQLLQKLMLYANELTNAAFIDFKMKIDQDLPEEKLNMEERRNIYLICKEAIHNAVKYSKGNEIEMKVLKEDHTMQISIRDNGCGFNTESFFIGNGLINMQTRAKEIAAELIVESAKERGTKVGLKMKL